MIKAIETVYNGYRFRSRLEARWAVFFDTLGIKYKYELDGFDLNGKWYLPDFWLSEQQCWIEVKGQEPTEEEEEKANLLAIYTEKPVYIFHGDVWIPEPFDADLRIKWSTTQDKRSAIRYGDFYVVNEDDRDEGYNPKPFKVPPHILALFYLWRHDLSVRLNVCCNELVIAAPIQIIPRVLSQVRPYEKELISLLSSREEDRFSLDGSPFSAHYWCECPKCHSLGIGNLGYSGYLPCGCVLKGYKQGGIIPFLREDFTHKTPRLIAAYTAARQARFEHR